MTSAQPGNEVIENVQALITALTDAWQAGDAAAFGRVFGAEALFVAFDGTVLEGPGAISRYHQQAFSTHLAGTRLHVEIQALREIAPGVSVLLTHGGIRRNAETHGALIGPSVQTFVIRETHRALAIESFHNTRARPIKGPQEAQVWRDFDLAWSRLAEAARPR